MSPNAAGLAVRDLVKHFPVRRRGGWLARPEVVRAVDGVSFEVRPGSTMGLVGESGCGKSTLGRTLVRLEDATGGSVRLDGTDVLSARGSALRRLRRDVQIVFQDPYASLNPRLTVRDILQEPFEIHDRAAARDNAAKVATLLDAVGLPASYAVRYPNELSGGQRQRVGIARALALDPKLIVCDEPVSALDVSIQAQILNLLARLKRERGLSYLFIAHGLAAVKHISDVVGVMYLGKLVEVAPKARLFQAPAHPYTQALLAAHPKPDPRAPRLPPALDGDVPSPIRPPSGCRFHTRCPRMAEVGERCRVEPPADRAIAPGHRVACHLY